MQKMATDYLSKLAEFKIFEAKMKLQERLLKEFMVKNSIKQIDSEFGMLKLEKVSKYMFDISLVTDIEKYYTMKEQTHFKKILKGNDDEIL